MNCAYYMPTPWETIPTIRSSVSCKVEYDTTLSNIMKLECEMLSRKKQTYSARLKRQCWNRQVSATPEPRKVDKHCSVQHVAPVLSLRRSYLVNAGKL
jgi:hypothetical protein